MNFAPVAFAIGRLYLLVVAGYLIFRPSFLQHQVLPRLLKALLWVGFPLYSIDRINAGWAEAIALGWQGMVGFFLLGAGMIGFQFYLGRNLIRRVPGLRTDHPRELLVLFALHNAGYIPLAFLGVLVSDGIMVYLFYYVMAFNFLFWTFSIPLLEKGNPRFTVRITPPLVGIFLGVILAATGWYRFVPEGFGAAFSLVGKISLDLILVVLGGTLAPLTFGSWKGYTELRWLVGIKLVAYPLFMTLVAVVARYSLGLILPEEFAWGIGMVIIVEAAVPPGTNIMVVARAWASERQNEFLGGGMLLTYGASLVTLPLFVGLGILLL